MCLNLLVLRAHKQDLEDCRSGLSREISVLELWEQSYQPPPGLEAKSKHKFVLRAMFGSSHTPVCCSEL